MIPAPLPHQQLRAATQPSHDRVDAAYGRFDLGDRASYSEFLLAHARVLPAFEAVLAGASELPPFEPRTPMLTQDFAALGLTMPDGLAVPQPPSSAAAWATLYVVEGSRLGGVMLARSVGDDLPHAFLSAGHARGGWRALLAAFDQAAEGEAWMNEAVEAATQVFHFYAKSADRSGLAAK